MELDAALAQAQDLLPTSTWVEVTAPFDALTLEMQGTLEQFIQAAVSAGTGLAFFERSLLTPAEFSIEEEEEERWVRMPLIEFPAMEPFRDRLGQPWLLRLFFLHGGHRIEWHLRPPWWPAFEAALKSAEGQQQIAHERAATQRHAESQREAKQQLAVLQEALPQDAAFIALACEPRPRITALRRRADEVLEERLGGGSVDGSQSSFLSELAQQLRQQHRRK